MIFEGATLEQQSHRIESDYPLDGSICMFHLKEGGNFVGLMNWSGKSKDAHVVNLEIKARPTFSIDAIEQWQALLNDRGGFYYLRKEN